MKCDPSPNHQHFAQLAPSTLQLFILKYFNPNTRIHVISTSKYVNVHLQKGEAFSYITTVPLSHLT